MRVVYTDQAKTSLQANVDFLLLQGIPLEIILRIAEDIDIKTQKLVANPYLGQVEEHISNPSKNYRRLIEGHYKIIYYISGETIYITDIFDSRQDPLKMKG